MEVKDGLLTSSHLPPGFRFHPTDEELINCYLSKKVTSSLPSDWEIVADIDIYKFNPWDLPGKALIFGEGEWFFFSPRERKYPNGLRPNRSAGSGYWKATGTDKPILSAGGTHCIGVKKALVFYKGRPPKGTKTDWVMHEYRVLDSQTSPKQKGSMRLDDWVLCRVRKKGSFLASSDEVTETSSPAESALTISPQSEGNVVMESSCFTDWNNDTQLLNYTLFDPHQESDFAEEVYSNLCGSGSSSGDYFDIPSAFGSVKRKLSYDPLDELMFLQPGKRLQCSPEELLSPANSVCVNQGFPDYFL